MPRCPYITALVIIQRFVPYKQKLTSGVVSLNEQAVIRQDTGMFLSSLAIYPNDPGLHTHTVHSKPSLTPNTS